MHLKQGASCLLPLFWVCLHGLQEIGHRCGTERVMCSCYCTSSCPMLSGMARSVGDRDPAYRVLTMDASAHWHWIMCLLTCTRMWEEASPSRAATSVGNTKRSSRSDKICRQTHVHAKRINERLQLTSMYLLTFWTAVSHA